MSDNNKNPDKPCPICKNSDFSYKFSAPDYITGETFDLYKCHSCQTISTYPLLTDSEISKYYQQTYYGNRKLFIDSLVNLLRRVGSGFNFKEKKSVLDIGCGTGSFLLGLKRKGWEVSGTEFAPPAYINPEIYPHIIQKPIDQCGYPDRSFDIVTMWHFLEHADNPVLYLNEANRLLKPGGQLLVEVPNINSWQAIVTESNWFNTEVPRHRTHFSPQTLSALLAKSGFDHMEVSYANFIYNIYGSVQSFLNLFSKRKNLLFDFLNGKIPKSEILKNKSDFTVIFFCVVPLVLVSTVLCLGEIIFRRGGIMLLKASKR